MGGGGAITEDETGGLASDSNEEGEESEEKQGELKTYPLHGCTPPRAADRQRSWPSRGNSARARAESRICETGTASLRRSHVPPSPVAILLARLIRADGACVNKEA